MFAALCSFSRRAPRACDAALDALSGPSRAAVLSASNQACAAWAGAASHHQWPARDAAEAALWTRLGSTSVSGEGAVAGASQPSTSGPQLPDWQAVRQRSDAAGVLLQQSVWQLAAGGALIFGDRRSALRHGGNGQHRRMATARGSAVPLQTARVEHAPIAMDGHGEAPAPRAAPAGRHAEHPFPVKAFYIGAPLHPVVQLAKNRGWTVAQQLNIFLPGRRSVLFTFTASADICCTAAATGFKSKLRSTKTHPAFISVAHPRDSAAIRRQQARCGGAAQPGARGAVSRGVAKGRQHHHVRAAGVRDIRERGRDGATLWLTAHTEYQRTYGTWACSQTACARHHSRSSRRCAAYSDRTSLQYHCALMVQCRPEPMAAKQADL